MPINAHRMDIRWLLSAWALLSCRSAALIVGGLRRHLHRNHDRLGCSVGSRKVETSKVSGSVMFFIVIIFVLAVRSAFFFFFLMVY